MAIDYIRGLQNRPQVNGSGIRPGRSVSPSGQLIDIPMSPDHPNWRSQIPAPEPLPEDENPHLYLPPTVQPVAPVQSAGQKRLSIYYGRKEGEYILIVETAPDWDGESKWSLGGETVPAIAGVVRALGVKVRNNTMEDFGE